MLRATLRGRPWEADRLANGLRDLVAREQVTFAPDILHVTRWVLAGLGRANPDAASVLTAFDAWHLNVEASVAVTSRWRRPLLRAEAQRVRRFEAEEFGHFRSVVVVTDQDKAALQNLNPRLPLCVIPNGVDAAFFSGGAGARVSHRIVFTGNMGYPPNIIAAKFLVGQILPRVRRTYPDAHAVVVGRQPSRDVLALADVDGVEVTGEVSDIRPWLQSAHVFVCPMLSGTGIKNKLLEAMATELPCVTTPLALQGLAVAAGEEVLVGQTPEELAAHVITVLRDDAIAHSLGVAARRHVLERHSWTAAAKAYGGVYRDVLRATQGKAH
jgi:glycosyltransferase involved in cell wall biosynthesis